MTKILKLNEFVNTANKFNGIKENSTYQQRWKEHNERVAQLGEPITDTREIEMCLMNVAKHKEIKIPHYIMDVEKINSPQNVKLIYDLFRCQLQDQSQLTNNMIKYIFEIFKNMDVFDDAEDIVNTFGGVEKFDGDLYLTGTSPDDDKIYDHFNDYDGFSFYIRNAEITLQIGDYKYDNNLKQGLYVQTLMGQSEPDLDFCINNSFVEKLIDELMNGIIDEVYNVYDGIPNVDYGPDDDREDDEW